MKDINKYIIESILDDDEQLSNKKLINYDIRWIADLDKDNIKAAFHMGDDDISKMITALTEFDNKFIDYIYTPWTSVGKNGFYFGITVYTDENKFNSYYELCYVEYDKDKKWHMYEGGPGNKHGMTKAEVKPYNTVLRKFNKTIK